MEEWKEYKLGKVAVFSQGIQVGIEKQIETCKEGYVRFIRIVDYTKGIDAPRYILYPGARYMVDETDIVMMRYGTPGKVARGYSGAIANNMFKITVNEDFLNKDYTFYYLSQDSVYRTLVASNSSSTMPAINFKIIERLDISAPSISEQMRIVKLLKSLDDKIEVNRKINENLEQQAQALFKSWFVDFEPFKDGEFVESELGMIPKGWRVGTFLDNIKVMPGGTPSTSRSEYWDDGTIPFFSPKDVNGVYCFETEKNITELGLNNCSSNLYPKDTLFITARGTVGKLTLAGVPMAMNQSNYALVAREGVGKYYLYLITQTLVSVLLKKANGAVFSAITTRDFNEPTLMPTHNDLKNFELLVTPIFKKIFQTSVESRRLAELRDTLLPKLMSGELKVNEIEI